MLRKIKIWLQMSIMLGSAINAARAIDKMMRFYVLKGLEEDGLFTFLQIPESYDKILKDLDYVNNTFTRELFDLLLSNNVLTLSGERQKYWIAPGFTLPDHNTLMEDINEQSQDLLPLFKTQAGLISARLHGDSQTIAASMEKINFGVTQAMDATLSSKLYSKNVSEKGQEEATGINFSDGNQKSIPQ